MPVPAVRVSRASSEGRFDDGRGIEGIAVIPHESVELDPQDFGWR